MRQRYAGGFPDLGKTANPYPYGEASYAQRLRQEKGLPQATPMNTDIYLCLSVIPFKLIRIFARSLISYNGKPSPKLPRLFVIGERSEAVTAVGVSHRQDKRKDESQN
ncbi:hypothetical protein BZZ01_12985 [Nostocales cyanobacterium HT-58-2]|nr:hypothetical protein BZZ01_12985 [Nostocales cyanobacterium HT-58-2]